MPDTFLGLWGKTQQAKKAYSYGAYIIVGKNRQQTRFKKPKNMVYLYTML